MSRLTEQELTEILDSVSTDGPTKHVNGFRFSGCWFPAPIRVSRYGR